jgi:integrase
MGRNPKPIYKDVTSGNFFARWYDENDKKICLSTNTADEVEAFKRYPVVKASKMSYNQYLKTTSKMKTLVVNAIGGHELQPGLTMPVAPDAVSALISAVLPKGQANFDTQRAWWLIKALGNGVPTDSTAMPESVPQVSGDSLFRGLDSLRSAVIQDNWQDIQDFYRVSMLNSYRDKKRALRFGNIWLTFLEKFGITSWNQITETLINEFKDWRKKTPIPKGTGSKMMAPPPSNAILNQHISYLAKSFNKAVALRKITINPIYEIKPWKEVHTKKRQDVLTFDEFKKVLALFNGFILEAILLIFCSCKRRKEIVRLNVEDIDFGRHYAHYTEWKNTGKDGLITEKAFHLTPVMEAFLQRIIGSRTAGPIWPGLNPARVSERFDEALAKVCPKKNTTLKNLRQLCTQVMTDAGLSSDEKDFTLHNTVTEKFYENQSTEAVYSRLAERTRKGVEVLSKSIEGYFI